MTKRQQWEANRARWLHPPTWRKIKSVIRKHRVSMAAFERFYGIPTNTLTMVGKKKRKLPVVFWHIFLSEEAAYKILTKPQAKKETKKPVSEVNIELAQKLNQFKKANA